MDSETVLFVLQVADIRDSLAVVKRLYEAPYPDGMGVVEVKVVQGEEVPLTWASWFDVKTDWVKMCGVGCGV